MTLEYLRMNDAEAESEIYKSLQLYDHDERLRYAEIGLMAHAVDSRFLWKLRIDPVDGFPCRSFARWVRCACPYAYSTVYASLRDVQALSDVPADDLAQIPQGNFRTLKQLSTAVRRDPEVLEAAKGKSEGFIAHVKERFPDQHVERDSMFKVPLNETQMADVEEALAKAIARGCASRSEAVWMWAVEELSKDEVPLAEVANEKCGHA